MRECFRDCQIWTLFLSELFRHGLNNDQLPLPDPRPVARRVRIQPSRELHCAFDEEEVAIGVCDANEDILALPAKFHQDPDDQPFILNAIPKPS